jgi:hypothetical protein
MAKDPRIVERSEYGRTLDNWDSHFPPERLIVARLHLEDLRSLERRFGRPARGWRERAERSLGS